jgi:cyclopropane fatty-acyl-phospholipid synthase-like methyltransferase
MKADQHPLYSDPKLVSELTRHVLERGFTVFQLFQFPGGERAHSLKTLSLAAIPYGGSVLSLGAGVGGMEAYWMENRPDLRVELQNLQAEQSDFTVAKRARVTLGDAQGYVSDDAPFDCVVMAYMLGHVDVMATLESALRNMRRDGCLLVLDVFDSTMHFNKVACYTSPQFDQLRTFAAGNGLSIKIVAGMKPCEYALQESPEGLLQQTSPMTIVMRRLAP